MCKLLLKAPNDHYLEMVSHKGDICLNYYKGSNCYSIIFANIYFMKDLLICAKLFYSEEMYVSVRTKLCRLGCHNKENACVMYLLYMYYTHQ